MSSLALGANRTLPPPKHYHEAYVIEAVGSLLFLVMLAYFAGLLIWCFWERRRIKSNGQDKSRAESLETDKPQSLRRAASTDEIESIEKRDASPHASSEGTTGSSRRRSTAASVKPTNLL